MMSNTNLNIRSIEVKHSYRLGEQARACDIQSSDSEAEYILKASLLGRGDGVFVRRSDDTWSFAIVRRKVLLGDKPHIDLIMSGESQKTLSIKRWASSIRCIRNTTSTLTSSKSFGSYLSSEHKSKKDTANEPKPNDSFELRRQSLGSCLSSAYKSKNGAFNKPQPNDPFTLRRPTVQFSSADTLPASKSSFGSYIFSSAHKSKNDTTNKPQPNEPFTLVRPVMRPSIPFSSADTPPASKSYGSYLSSAHKSKSVDVANKGQNEPFTLVRPVMRPSIPSSKADTLPTSKSFGLYLSSAHKSKEEAASKPGPSDPFALRRPSVPPSRDSHSMNGNREQDANESSHTASTISLSSVEENDEDEQRDSAAGPKEQAGSRSTRAKIDLGSSIVLRQQSQESTKTKCQAEPQQSIAGRKAQTKISSRRATIDLGSSIVLRQQAKESTEKTCRDGPRKSEAGGKGRTKRTPTRRATVDDVERSIVLSSSYKQMQDLVNCQANFKSLFVDFLQKPEPLQEKPESKFSHRRSTM